MSNNSEQSGPIRIAVFSSRAYDREYLSKAAATSARPIAFDFFEARLTVHTAALAREHLGVCVFINDDVSHGVLTTLHALGVRFVALRAAGFNKVDLVAAKALGVRVVRVPKYSPEAVAEHGVALLLSVARKLHRAVTRVHDDNFALDGLVGRNINGSTVGVVGTGQIGIAFARILAGFGVELIAYDVIRTDDFTRLGGKYVDSLDELLARSDIISLHCPLLDSTHHIINAAAIAQLKPGCILINTSRGALVDTRALIEGLKSGQVAGAGIDVYEAEEAIFGQDFSDSVVQDDLFQLLQSFTNVLVTAHMAFFTKTALENIARTTVENIGKCVSDEPSPNDVK